MHICFERAIIKTALSCQETICNWFCVLLRKGRVCPDGGTFFSPFDISHVSIQKTWLFMKLILHLHAILSSIYLAMEGYGSLCAHLLQFQFYTSFSVLHFLFHAQKSYFITANFACKNTFLSFSRVSYEGQPNPLNDERFR